MDESDLIEMEAEKDVEGLIKALDEREKLYVQLGAVHALRRIKDKRAVEPLIKTLKAYDGDVRYGVAWALGDIGDARAVKSLVEALEKDESIMVRARAARALGKIGKPAVEPLIKALKEKNIVRDCIAEALGEIGDAKAVEPLTQALKDENTSVQFSATEALEKIKWKNN
jgi:HEAT repeat protein